MRETRVWSLGREDPLEKEMATHSSTVARRIPWREEPGRLQSMGSQRVGHDWETSLSPRLSTYYTATIVKNRQRNRLVDDGTEQEDPEFGSHKCAQMMFWHWCKEIQWSNNSIFNKWCWAIHRGKKMNLDSKFTLYRKINSKWFTIVKCKKENYKTFSKTQRRNSSWSWTRQN